MSVQLANRAGAGVIFGAALTASRVYVPSVIISQMKLQDFHMMATFLTASAGSAYVIIPLNLLFFEGTNTNSSQASSLHSSTTCPLQNVNHVQTPPTIGFLRTTLT